MGKLFRGMAIGEFVAIGLVSVFRILVSISKSDFEAFIIALIGGLIAVLFVLPLFVLGQMVDQVKEQQQLINYLMVKVKEGSNDTPEAQARKKDHRVLFPNHWKCSCGRDNAGYVSTCACGKNKHELGE